MKFCLLAVVASSLVITATGSTVTAAIVERINGQIVARLVEGTADDLKGVRFGAIAVQKDARQENGWVELNVTTDGTISDSEQAYQAGYAEGTLHVSLINQYYNNFVVHYWKWPTEADIPLKIRNYLTANLQFMQQSVESNPNDSYWKQVGLMNSQFLGLVDGYTNQSRKLGTTPLSLVQLHVLVAGGDLFELSGLPEGNETRAMVYSTSKVPSDGWQNGHCSALFKLKDDLTDVFFGHTSWFTYMVMLRVMKRYTFHYSITAAQVVVMSSYPGVLSSFDDFYVMDSGLASIETSSGFFNQSMYDYIVPTTLQYWVRVMVANRGATTSAQWCELVARENSGTYNNQWMVIDYKQFKPGFPLPAGTFYVLDQLPGPYIEWADQTEVLNFGYWPSFNIPFYKSLRDAAGWTERARTDPSYSFAGAARAQIFRRNESSVNTLADFERMLRYNNFRVDPLSHGSPVLTISARGDLEPTPSCFGGYDTKVSSATLASRGLLVRAQNGPTHDQQPVFSFANASFCPQGLQGLVETYDFPFVQFPLAS